MYPEDGVVDRDSPVDNGLGRLKINLEKIVFPEAIESVVVSFEKGFVFYGNVDGVVLSEGRLPLFVFLNGSGLYRQNDPNRVPGDERLDLRRFLGPDLFFGCGFFRLHVGHPPSQCSTRCCGTSSAVLPYGSSLEEESDGERGAGNFSFC